MTGQQLGDGAAIVIHATPADHAVVKKTVPHLLANKRPDIAAYLMVDSAPLLGRLATNQPQRPVDVATNECFQRICTDGTGLRLVHTLRSPDHIAEIGATFFGDESMPPNCAAGTPVYPFLAGLLAPRTRFVAHYDADILLHDPGDWLAAGIDLMQRDESVVIVNPHRGSGRANCRTEGSEARCSCSPNALVVSTRCFLVDLRRLLERAPLSGHRHTGPRRLRYRLQGRSTLRPLEHILTDFLQASEYRMATLAADSAFTIHGVQRRYFEEKQIDTTISAVAKGEIPPHQQGEENLLGLW